MHQLGCSSTVSVTVARLEALVVVSVAGEVKVSAPEQFKVAVQLKDPSKLRTKVPLSSRLSIFHVQGVAVVTCSTR